MEYEMCSQLKLSRLEIGAYSLTGVYGKKNLGVYKKVLEKAYEEGITFFDTSDSYGHGEEVLGRAVMPFRQQIALATKLGAKKDFASHLSCASIISSTLMILIPQ